MRSGPIERIALFGDEVGVPQLLKSLPQEVVSCLVGASIRPAGHQTLNQLAEELEVPFLIQPRKKDGDYLRFVEQLAELSPQMILCNSYSLLIREEVRRIAEPHVINIHGALLPKNRGCNPIQWAIIKGEEEFGVTMHLMDHSFDTGDIVAQRRFPIGESETWIEIRDRLWLESESLISDMVPLLLEGTYPRMPQDRQQATHNPRLTADSPRIDFAAMNDREVCNLIRAQVSPLGGAFLEWEGERIHFPNRLTLDEVADLRRRYGPELCHTSA